MQCLYCGKALSLLKELTDREFCSRDHREQYKRLTRLALSRLREPALEPAGMHPRQRTKPEGLPPPRPAKSAWAFAGGGRIPPPRYNATPMAVASLLDGSYGLEALSGLGYVAVPA